MRGFIDFIRKQGVVAFAVAFILGGAVSSLVSSIIKDLVSPLIGLVLGNVGGLEAATLSIGSARLMVGNFIGTLIDFVVIAFVVYFGVMSLGLDKLDKKD
jgi:large conductance mechanosensitive channel